MFRHVKVINGEVFIFSTTFGRYIKSPFPAVDLARHETIQKIFPRFHLHHGFTDDEREIAKRFDLEKAIAEIKKVREESSLPTDAETK